MTYDVKFHVARPTTSTLAAKLPTWYSYLLQCLLAMILADIILDFIVV